MRVKVDEAGGYYEPEGIDDSLGPAQSSSHGGDLAIQQRYVAHGVHSAGRIYHPASADHQATHIDTPHSLNSPLPQGGSGLRVALRRPWACQ